MNRVRLAITATVAIAASGLIATGALSAYAAGSSQPPRAATNAATGTLKVLTHNICGASCGAGELESATAATLSEIKSWDPDIVMLQEVCYEQYEYIVSELGDGYSADFSPMLDSNDDCQRADNSATDLRAGQVLVSKGPMAGGEVIDLGGDSYGNDGKDYTALCYDLTVADLGENKVKACVSHIRAFHNADELWNYRARSAQLGTYASEMDDDLLAEDQVVVLGGDLNERPYRSPLDPIYQLGPDSEADGIGAFIEADQTDETYFPDDSGCTTACRSGGPTLNGDRKYDYIFFDALHASDPSGGVIPADPSDHEILRGSATITTD